MLYVSIFFFFFLNLNCFQKDTGVIFSISDPHFHLMTIHLVVDMIQRRLLFMMFDIHQVLMTTEFILVVDSSNWKGGKFIIIAVQTSYSLTDNSYLSLRHLSVIFVTRIALPQQILFYTRNMFIYVCLYLFVLFVILLTLLILVYVCTSPNLMVAQRQQFL